MPGFTVTNNDTLCINTKQCIGKEERKKKTTPHAFDFAIMQKYALRQLRHVFKNENKLNGDGAYI